LIEEEFGTNVTYEFSNNKKVEICNGNDSLIANCLQPLATYSITKSFFYQSTCDYITSFFTTALGSLNSFRFRDPCDNFATNTVYNSGFGTSTQGVVLPNPDGSNKVFKLYKAYNLGSYVAYRNISKPIVSTLKVYVNGNLTTCSVNTSTGVITFSTAPPAGNGFGGVSRITWEGNFDVEVRFDSDTAVAIETKVYDDSISQWMFQLPTLKLVEVRDTNSIPTGSSRAPVTTIPDSINHVFGLDLSYDSVYQSQYKTLNTKLDNLFELRTQQFNYSKSVFKLGSAQLLDINKVEYLITLWRICLGNARLFKLTNHIKNITEYIRFNNTSLSFNVEVDSYVRSEQSFYLSGIELIGPGSSPPAVCVPTLTLTESIFNNWLNGRLTSVYGGLASSTATCEKVSSGGNPGSYLRITMVTTGYNQGGVSTTQGIAYFVFSPILSFDPSTQGSITSIDFSVDVQNEGSYSTQLTLAVLQNGIVYDCSDRGAVAISNTSWTNKGINGLNSGFGAVCTNLGASIPSGAPVFNPSGNPIRFGIVIKNYNIAATLSRTSVASIDNLQIVVNADCD